MSKVRVGGSIFCWDEVETNFKYAKEVSKGIGKAIEYGFDNCSVLKYINVNKLCLDTFKNIIDNYSDNCLLNWFRSKIKNGNKITLDNLDVPDCVTDYAMEIMLLVIKQKQNKFIKLVATI